MFKKIFAPIAIVAVFALCVGFLLNLSVQTLLFKQYEQQLKSLDDALKIGLLDTLDKASIKEFGAKTGADFIIRGDGKALNSFNKSEEFLIFAQNEPNYVDFVQRSIANGLSSGLSTRDVSSKLIKAEFEGRTILYKAHEFKAYRYIIIVYPRILGLESYFKSVGVAFGLGLAGILIILLINAKVLKNGTLTAKKAKKVPKNKA